jgi:tetratricopeptide (TPR) repeat protein
MSEAKISHAELRIEGVDLSEPGLSVRGTIHGATWPASEPPELSAELQDGSRVAVTFASNGDGSDKSLAFVLELPSQQPAQITNLTFKGPGFAQTATAQTYFGKAHRWLFAPLPVISKEIAADVQRYHTRITNRQLLFQYAKALGGNAMQMEGPKDPMLLGMVTTVMIYRMLDIRRFASPENQVLLRQYFEGFKQNEEALPSNHWKLSTRFAFAQYTLAFEYYDETITLLEEVRALRDVAAKEYMMIYNFVKATLLLATIYTLKGESEKARATFADAIELGYHAPSIAPRIYPMAVELAEIFRLCSLCIAGQAEAGDRKAGSRIYRGKTYDFAGAIHSSLRFKNKGELEKVTQRTLQAYSQGMILLPEAPPEVGAEVQHAGEAEVDV